MSVLTGQVPATRFAMAWNRVPGPPTVIELGANPGGTDVLFGGAVRRPDGAPIPGAILEVWGVRLRSEEDGTFELLVRGHQPGNPAIAVTVTVEGARPLEVVVTVPPVVLADGTRVVLQDFVLAAQAA